MTRSIVRQLALKDLYLARWTLLASIAVGAVAIAITPFGSRAFYVGSVSFICILVILNIFVVMSGVLWEKQEQAHVFLLSLPISTTGYWLVKVATNVAMFVVPWLILTAAGVIVIDRSAIPNGIIPFTVAISAFILCYYCVLLGVAVTTTSLAWTTAVIVAGNVSVNFFIPFVFQLPSAATSVKLERAVWSPDIVITLAIEAVFCAAALAIAVAAQMRKRDFI
jgi:hypothetical protein